MQLVPALVLSALASHHSRAGYQALFRLDSDGMAAAAAHFRASARATAWDPGQRLDHARDLSSLGAALALVGRDRDAEPPLRESLASRTRRRALGRRLTGV